MTAMTSSSGSDILDVSGLRTFFPVKSRGIIPRTVGQVLNETGLTEEELAGLIELRRPTAS